MELVLIVTAAGLIGALVRYLVPGRALHGLAVLPAAGVIAGSLLWVILVWVGSPQNAWWSWAIAVGLTTVAVVVVALILPKRRQADEDALWAEMTGHSPTRK